MCLSLASPLKMLYLFLFNRAVFCKERSLPCRGFTTKYVCPNPKRCNPHLSRSHADGPMVLLLLSALPGGSCVGKRKCLPKISFEGIHAECWCGADRAQIQPDPWMFPAPLIATLPPLRLTAQGMLWCLQNTMANYSRPPPLQKVAPVTRTKKDTIFPIWFAPPRHSLSHSQLCWEQSCILPGWRVPAMT